MSDFETLEMSAVEDLTETEEEIYVFPMSYAQERLWFLHQINESSPQYNIAGKITLTGELDVEILKKSFEEIINRHEILRTNFRPIKGETNQIIYNSAETNFRFVDLSHLSENKKSDVLESKINQTSRKPFDLEKDSLIKAVLYKINPTEHILLVVKHHIISDASSLHILIKELAHLYESFEKESEPNLNELAIQYADYAVWQKEVGQTEKFRENFKYWQNLFSDEIPVLNLSTDKKRPANQVFSGARCPIEIPEDLLNRVKDFCAKENLTVFILLQTAYALTLSKYSGQTDFVIGIPVANRNSEDVENMIGCFVNLVPVRIKIKQTIKVADLLKSVKKQTFDALGNQDIPFEKIVEWLNIKRTANQTPLVQVAMDFHESLSANLQLSNLKAEISQVSTNTTKFDLTLYLESAENKIHGFFEFSDELFELQTIEQFRDAWLYVLEQIISNPNAVVKTITFWDNDKEREQIERMSGERREFDSSRSLLGEIVSNALRRRDETAIVDRRGRATYGEILERAEELALILRGCGIRAEQIVGVVLPRSKQYVISLLGVWLANGAYLPVEEKIPLSRQAYMFTDAGVRIVICGEGEADKYQEMDIDVVIEWKERERPLRADEGVCRAARSGRRIERVKNSGRRDQETEHQTAASEEWVNGLWNGEDGSELAYVLYTSGSTGRPKGVAVERRSLRNLVEWHCRKYEVSGETVATLVASIGFDASVWEMWSYVSRGGRLVVIEDEERMEIEVLMDKLETEKVTHTFLPTPLAETIYLTGKEIGVKHLLTGGDNLQSYLQFNNGCRAWNHYGPSEATVVTTSGEIKRAGDGSERNPTIGRGISNVEVYILDEMKQIVPEGVIGELHIGGAGLARGYIGRSDLTAEKFIPNPFSEKAGERMYETGDLVRYVRGEGIEFIERKDEQVKVRGYRIELGEIESRLKEEAGIREAAAVVREMSGSRQIVAFVVTEESEGKDWTEQRRRIEKRLSEEMPEYMMPARIERLAELPKTTNGKIDRKALRLREWEEETKERTEERERPRDEIEAKLGEIWEEVLHRKEIGINDNFFDLGGHSILAAQMLSRINKTFGIKIPIKSIFRNQKFINLSEQIKLQLQSNAPSKFEIKKIGKKDKYQTSFAQERIWFLQLMQPDSSIFHMPAFVNLEGNLNVEILRKNLNEIIERHKLLSARFEVENGQPVINLPEKSLELELPVKDISNLETDAKKKLTDEILQAEIHDGFDITKGNLIKASLLKLSPTSHILLVTLHHIIADGWSIGVLTDELAELYKATINQTKPDLPDLEIQYVDYAAWQRDYMRDEILTEKLSFWKEQLAGDLPVLNLPTDFPRPAIQSFEGEWLYFKISEQITAKINELAKKTNSTLYMVLLSCFHALLHRYTGQDDIITGSLVANRDVLEIEPLIGCFINALPVRVKNDGELNFLQLLERVKKSTLSAYSHQDLPFEKLVEELHPERDLSRTPIFQVMFALQNIPLKELELPELKITPIKTETGAVAYDLTFNVTEKDESLFCNIEYRTDLFRKETIENLFKHFENLLVEFINDPEIKISAAQMLNEKEQDKLLYGWNETEKEFPLRKSFARLFEEQVEKTPETTAAISDEGTLSYYELNERANKIAHQLIQMNVTTDTVLAILSERNLDFLTAVIAIFKAGAAYTPLDPAHPKERHRQIIEQSGAKIILTTEQFENEITEIIPAEHKKEISTFLIPKLINSDSPTLDLEVEIHPQSLAYVLFTSGSTGKPKGAMVEHIGMLNHLFAKIEDLEITSSDLIAQNASQCFDISVWQFLSGLLVGAAVRIVNDEVRHDPQTLMNLVEDEKITVLEVVPSLLQMLLEDFEHKKVEKPELKSLRWLIATGEALPPHFIKRWFKLYLQIPMLNAYGPTECSDDVTHQPIFAPLEMGVTQTPIGKAVSNINMYVLDKNLSPVPVNVNGELYVGGIGVGRGYIGDPVKTAQTFIPDPFGKNAGARLYKTGDLGNYMTDGTLKFLERIDHQVKIRGFRIELGEIESVLRQHKNIAEVVVVDREDETSGKTLAAYFIERKNEAENEADGQHIDDHIDQWKEVFDNVYKDEDNKINDAALNIRGWNNSYTGEQIPESEMSEWVEGTVNNILSLNPQRVLELGCGTGMLLYRIAPHCEKYWGSDLAPESINYLQELLAETPLENVDIKLLHRAADNFEAIEKNAFDTIILNSVAQYFPNVEYLLKVIENAAGVLDKGGKIYLGDIRNLKLLEALHFSIEAFTAKENLNRRQLKQTIKEKIREEDELLLDQNFFYALSKSIPRLTNIKISTKRGYAHNELTGFRYDVVLSFDDEVSEQISEVEKIDWKSAELSLEKLKEKLVKQNSPQALVVKIFRTPERFLNPKA